MNQLVIREASSKDIKGMVNVLKTIYLQDEDWARKAIKKLLETENYVILVAELNGIVVGFIDYYVLPSIWEKWNEATINYLFIHKDHQGKGLGSKLLKEMTKRTDKMGIVELHVGTEMDNKRAIHLYKKHGFTKEYLLLERIREGMKNKLVSEVQKKYKGLHIVLLGQGEAKYVHSRQGQIDGANREL